MPTQTYAYVHAHAHRTPTCTFPCHTQVKRIGVISGDTYSTTLAFAAPVDLGLTSLSLWLVADSVLGLDVETAIPVEVIPGGDEEDDAQMGEGGQDPSGNAG